MQSKKIRERRKSANQATLLRIMGTSRLLTVLRHDPRAIFKAAAQAQAALDWIHAHAGAAASPLPLAA